MNNQNNNEGNDMGAINLENLSSDLEEVELLQPTINNDNQTISNMTEIPVQVQSVNSQNSTMFQGQALDNNSPMNANVSDNNASNHNVSYDDERLLEAFIGKNQEKILESSFNFAGLFFGQFYLFYRKMFVYGILIFIINIILVTFAKMIFLTLFINLAVGLTVNKMYINFAKKKINKILVNNQNKSQHELETICAKNGGTSVIQLFFGLFIEFVIALVIVVISIIFGLSTIFGSLVSNLNDLFSNSNFENSASNGIYDGTFNYNSSIIISDEFSISIPSNFEEGMFNDEHMYNYEYSSNQGMFDNCRFSLAAVDNFSDAENMADQIYNYFSNSNPASVSSIKINNINWFSLSYSDSMGTNYFYLAEKDNKVYLFEYVIEENADSNCINYKDRVVTSIIAK
ncbi:MAG: DUF2628 domain-containing protein [Bacilli bacterium]|nr:DUF2628 domain-containing protein [Bacilli bacterium]